MIVKLIKKINVKIKEVQIEDSLRPDYSKLVGCLKCGCPLFPEEQMCPDCLTPRI